MAAHPRVARGDGRRVRALRSGRGPAARRHRHRSRLRIRPAVPWRAGPDAVDPAGPLRRRAPVARRAWLAGLQAQAMRDSGRFGEVPDVPATVVADGAAALVLAVGDRAEALTKTPVWIRGMDHRIEPASLGVRDLSTSPSVEMAAQNVGAQGVDAAWLHVLYPHQELLLRKSLGLGDARVDAKAGPMMVGGLERFAAAAAGISSRSATRAVVHATSGPCLQQNLVAVLEGAA